MKTNICIAILAICIACLSISMYRNPIKKSTQFVHLSQIDSGRTIVVHPKDRFDIELRFAGGDYFYGMSYDSNILGYKHHSDGNKEIKKNKKGPEIVGSLGAETFLFDAIGTGRTSVIIMSQPKDSLNIPEIVFSVNVEVK